MVVPSFVVIVGTFYSPYSLIKWMDENLATRNESELGAAIAERVRKPCYRKAMDAGGKASDAFVTRGDNRRTVRKTAGKKQARKPRTHMRAPARIWSCSGETLKTGVACR